MILEYIILCLTLVYVGAVIIVYRKSKKSRSDG
jgi:cbb3-type cytochrome oxidase subunit 3